jgi:hypothetical protein
LASRHRSGRKRVHAMALTESDQLRGLSLGAYVTAMGQCRPG